MIYRPSLKQELLHCRLVSKVLWEWEEIVAKSEVGKKVIRSATSLDVGIVKFRRLH